MKKKLFAALLAVGFLCVVSDNQAIAEEKDSDVLDTLQEHVQISGAVEVEINWNEDYDATNSSDIALSTATLGIEASIVEWASGTIVFDWDDEEDEIGIDEAYITLGNTEAIPFALQAGRLYVPFGVFETSAVSDPLTLEAFETREEAVMTSYGINGVNFGIYGFNGDTNENGGDDTIEHFGGFLDYSLEKESLTLNAHLGYMSSIIDSDTLQDNLDLESDYVGGVSAQLSLQYSGFILIGEYITATEDYEPDEGDAQKPSAFHIEAGYTMELGLPVFAAISYSGTDNLGGVLPETRLAPVIGVELVEGLTAKLEYCHDTDYEEADGGTGEESDTVTLLLSYEF